MKDFFPAYYDRFRCLAGACPDSCCQEWDVDVDPDSAKRYRALPGELGDALRAALTDTEDGTVLAQTSGRCPMWRQDGLCRIQAELGEQALCHVCRTFPRLTHEYEGFTEHALELSCPEAARLILTEAPGRWIPEAEGDLGFLVRSREQARDLLEDSRFSVGERLAVLLIFAGKAEDALCAGETVPDLDPEAALDTARELAGPGDMAPVLDFYKSLEILTPMWRQRLEAPAPDPWTGAHGRLARYFLDRYWLQAVSDGEVWARAKLVALSCQTVRFLGGGLQETAQLSSKEIENDPENIDAILDGAYSEKALTDANLLGLLLRP